jgi:uncharacterized damage-inducible protein DinB
LDAQYFRAMFDYHYWARNRLLEAADGLNDEDYGKPNGFTYGSIRAVLTHTLGAEVIWLNRMRGDGAPPLAPAREDDLPSLDYLVARWSEVESAQRAFLENLKDADLSTVIEYSLRDGTPMHATIWQLLTIVVTHSMQHRAEAAEALTKIKRSPGNLDFIVFMREA